MAGGIGRSWHWRLVAEVPRSAPEKKIVGGHFAISGLYDALQLRGPRHTLAIEPMPDRLWANANGCGKGGFANVFRFQIIAKLHARKLRTFRSVWQEQNVPCNCGSFAVCLRNGWARHQRQQR